MASYLLLVLLIGGIMGKYRIKIILLSTFIVAAANVPQNLYSNTLSCAVQLQNLAKDPGGMPTSFHEIKFTWNRSKVYERQIYAHRFGRRILLGPDTEDVFGYKLPQEMRRAFDQVRAGGNLFRSEITPAEFMANHPIPTFDHDTNIWLTKNYGPEFSGQIYKYIRDNQPDNKWARETILNFIADKNSVNFSLGEHFKGIKLLIAKGYLDGPKTSPSLPLAKMLQERGMVVEYFETESSAPVDTNAKIIADNLKERLQRGERVVVWGLSKGVTELLAALSVIQPLIDSKDGNSAGRVEGVISTSGVVGGSFLADWAAKYPQYLGVNYFVRRFAKNEGVPMSNVRAALRSLGKSFIDSYVFNGNTILPQSPVYVELSGVSANNNGYAADPDLKKFQKKVFDSPFFPAHSANDGFLEYPGTEIPRALVSKLYQITFTASHRIMDGTYEGYPMTDPQARDLVLSSIFRFLSVALNNQGSAGEP
jgi:hypothetical protein